MRSTLVAAIGLFILVTQSADVSASYRGLTFEERVSAQTAIERVHWAHRIWPADNPGAKPALEAVFPATAIEAQVEDYLRKSNALEKWWGRALTHDQLQAELDRMVRNSRQPETLREILAALGNDPFLAAECLARPALVDRLMRSWYAKDERFHGALRQRISEALGSDATREDLEAAGGRYREVTWKRLDTGAAARGSANGRAGEWAGGRVDASAGRRVGESTGGQVGGGAEVQAGTGIAKESADEVLFLDPEEWSTLEARLARRGASLAAPSLEDSIPLGRFGALEETEDSFTTTAVLARTSGSVRTANVSWAKQSLDAWWQQERTTVPRSLIVSERSYTLLSTTPTTCTENSWSVLTNFAPVNRTDHTAVWTGSEMLVWGGESEHAESSGTARAAENTGARYVPATDIWTTMGTGGQLPEARLNHTAVWTGTEMIVWGGQTNLNGPTQKINTGGRYNPLTDTWVAISLAVGVPTARVNHTAVWTGSRMIIWGGNAGGGATNSGSRYNPASDSWQPTSTNFPAPSSRDQHAAVWTGTEMIIWGGTFSTTSGGRYNPSTDTWTPTGIDANTPVFRSGPTGVWTGSEMIVWGGHQTGASSQVNSGGRYNPSTNAWTPTSVGANVPGARDDHTAVWTGSQMIVWGGTQGLGTLLGTGGRYTPATDTWTPTSVGGNVPSARSRHTAVWTGTEMIAWGGSSSVHTDNSGGRYKPATDSWVPTGVTYYAPAARSQHTAVWTGSEMIVWGGFNGSSILATGGRYLPSTDTWVSTSTSGGSLMERRYHSAVWTGTEMIVWGGAGGGTIQGSGARYNPASNTWTATSTGANAPVARYGHTGVWTGSSMLVWGGQSTNDGYLNTGSRYAPSTNTWLPMFAGAGTPSFRTQHTAIWTGSTMIIWGGIGPSGLLNSGGRYRPATDAWTPIAIDASTPTARYAHTAVWTGSEMIAWGGGDSSTQELNTGGRYNPDMDAWVPTSVGSNVPTPRPNHSAVWAGGEMIVWGGGSGVGLNTGGRYTPATDTWETTSLVIQPGRRYLHTAVWTGSQMIVWGGQSNTSIPYTATGGLYCPDALCSHAPPEVQNEAWAPGSKVRLGWSSVAGATRYEVYAGGAAGFPHLLTVQSESCSILTTNTTTTGDTLTANPPPGQVFWYLVRASSACVQGSAGNATAGPRQQSRWECNDGNPSTTDSCDPLAGCVYESFSDQDAP